MQLLVGEPRLGRVGVGVGQKRKEMAKEPRPPRGNGRSEAQREVSSLIRMIIQCSFEYCVLRSFDSEMTKFGIFYFESRFIDM